MQISNATNLVLLDWAKENTYAGCTGQAVGPDYAVQQLLYTEMALKADRNMLIERRNEYQDSMTRLPKWRRILIKWLSRGIMWF